MKDRLPHGILRADGASEVRSDHTPLALGVRNAIIAQVGLDGYMKIKWKLKDLLQWKLNIFPVKIEDMI